MVTFLEANQRVQALIRGEDYAKQNLDLVIRPRMSLEFPDGWRFPYNRIVAGVRVRHSRSIFFADKTDGTVTVEWDDFDTQLERKKWVEKVSDEVPLLSPLPLMPQLIEHIQQRDIQVEAVELVWDEDDEGEIQLHWRLILLEESRRSVMILKGSGSDEDLDVQLQKRQPIWKSASRGWDLGRTRFQKEVW